MKYLVLNVRNYSFKDGDGRLVEGATVTYLDLDNEPEEGEKGFAPLSVSATTEQARNFTHVPGFYEMEFSQRRAAQNKVRVVFRSATFKQAVNLGLRSEHPKVVQTP